MWRSVSTVLFHGQNVQSHFGHGIVQCSLTWTSNRIYSNPTHDKQQWLLLQFIVLLKMDAKDIWNMYSILVVFNKHNTARVASCWFIIYYSKEDLLFMQEIWQKLANNLPVLVTKVHILSCVQEIVGENWSFNAEVIMGQIQIKGM